MMMKLPSHPLRGPKRRTNSVANHPRDVRAPSLQREHKSSNSTGKEASVTRTGRSTVPAISEYNRFQNRRPCNDSVRPNALRDTGRVGRHAYTKDRNILVESVPDHTQGSFTKNPNPIPKMICFMVGERRGRGESLPTHTNPGPVGHLECRRLFIAADRLTAPGTPPIS
jgi:hypothetical protein